MSKEERRNVRDNARVTMGCLAVLGLDGILSSGTVGIIIGVAAISAFCYLLHCKSFVRQLL